VGEAIAAASKAHARRDQDSLPQFQQIGKQSCGFSDGHASLRGKSPTSFSELRLVARHLDGRESPLRTAHSARTIGEKLLVLSERSRKFRNLGIECRLNADGPTPATWQPVSGCPEVRGMPSLAHYMAQYDHEHESASNKLLHAIGIPMIFAGIILVLFLKWIWGTALFLGGWVLLFLGHRMEGNRPAFFQGPIYLLVGPIWVAREVCMFLVGTNRKPTSEGNPRSSASK